MISYLAVFVGSGIGGVFRFMVSSFVSRELSKNFPWSTLSVNLVGAFLIGVIVELLAIKYFNSASLHHLLIIGFLGGFTTFSAFSLESALMWSKGDYFLLTSYILASVIGTILLVFAGMYIVKLFI